MVGKTKVVSNEEFETALNNKDNALLIYSITNKYRGLDAETKRECGLTALWRALQKFDASYGQKFTSSLYRFVHWECRRFLARGKNKRTFVSVKPLEQEDVSELETKEFVERYVKLLPAYNREIIQLYYLEEKPLREIGKAYKLNNKELKVKLDESVAMLRKLAAKNGII